MKELLDKFDIGSSQSRDFPYCGKQFKTTEEGITVDVVDNTRRIKPIRVESGRPNADPLLAHETTQLRSVVGSLSWIARQGRPDLVYRVSRLQANTKDSSVHWLKEATALAFCQCWTHPSPTKRKEVTARTLSFPCASRAVEERGSRSF